MKTSYNHCKMGANFCIRMTLLQSIQFKASSWFSSIFCKHILKNLLAAKRKLSEKLHLMAKFYDHRHHSY